MQDDTQFPMMLPIELKTAFSNRVTEALSAISDTVGLCPALCAYISMRLTEDDIENRVALGSLSCNGVKAFQYKKPIPARPSVSTIWDGHAWLEFPNRIIGEPSLFRTAKASPRHSNLRQNLEILGLLDSGALLISETSALKDYGLKYRRMAYLNEQAYIPLIGGLLSKNGLC